MISVTQSIEALLEESRTIAPSEAFRKQANVTDASLWTRADVDPSGFWLDQAKELISWETEPTQGLDDSKAPFFTWFADGTLNVSANCLDRHVAAGRGDRVAYHYVPEPTDEEERTITYAELLADVERFANVLRSFGVERGDRVAIYMGMVPELPIAMLACARIGAPHSVVFGGFSATSLADRIQDAECKVLVTQDAAWRRGKRVLLKEIADQAVVDCPTIEHVVVVRRTGDEVAWNESLDTWWHDAVAGAEAHCSPVELSAEEVLYLLYTSGTTAKPKGIVHTSAGYLLGAITSMQWVFDLKSESDVWWCAADIGWVTGHTYIVYGPLASGVTSVLYEGAPDYPGWTRHWEIIAKHKVSIYYTAPTAIRAFVKAGDEHLGHHDLSSLRLLGTVGEPINPEVWVWYRDRIGRGECPVVDTWWQTETGAIAIAPVPGVTTLKPGSATRPLPGVDAAIFTEEGETRAGGEGGYLVIRRPMPSMLRTLWNEPERFRETYFSKYGPNVYVTGDGARRDLDGDFWLMGRVDDVINVAGHRLSTTEIESSLVGHPAVAEAAAIGADDEVKGQQIAAFVITKDGVEETEELRAELVQHVSDQISKIARPGMLLFAPDLPKTRSGKIMRRLLRNIAEGKPLGDATTLRDPEIVQSIKEDADRQLGRP